MMRTRRGSSFNGISLIFAIVGVALIIASILFGRYYAHTHEVCTGSVDGVVVELVRHESTSGTGSNRRRSITYAPVVQYVVSGQEYVVESRTSSYPPAYEVGDTVDVHYNPDNPAEVYFGKDSGTIILISVFVVIGASLCLISSVIFVQSRKKVV